MAPPVSAPTSTRRSNYRPGPHGPRRKCTDHDRPYRAMSSIFEHVGDGRQMAQASPPQPRSLSALASSCSKLGGVAPLRAE